MSPQPPASQTHSHDGQNGSGDAPLSEEELERLHFMKVMRTFQTYHEIQMPIIEKMESEYHSVLPPSHKKLLANNYLPRLANVKKLIVHNQRFLSEIVADAAHVFHNSNPLDERSSSQAALQQQQPTRYDYEKVRTTLRQFVRDWSTEGAEERAASYQPIIDELCARFPNEQKRANIRVLVPGAGLGRLAFEIAKLGFECQGNEWSVFMLFAANFILNKATGTDMFTIYPWVTQSCNQPGIEAMCRGVSIPDINPRSVELPEGAFSMVAGDFLEVYTQTEDWDAVTTCFFLDTAHNILAYLEKMFAILKPGGFLINLGPLLYHFSDTPGEFSLDLTYEEVLTAMEDIGFKILVRDDKKSSPYITNTQSLLQYIYTTPFLVAQKPVESRL